ncbi:MAG: hypothetical protein FWG64_00670 [Firmicutes bacterium]|nr:hypothetical protein [Bacillota bacterium]
MIKITNFSITTENAAARLIQPLEINGEKMEIYAEVASENAKYFVTDRADALVIGILPLAQRQNYDIYSDLPISGELLYSLNNILIPMLAKYDSTLSNIKIHANPINTPVETCGAVGTGISLGADALTTIAQYHKHPVEKMRLTHFLSFDSGAFGGYFQESGWDFQANLIYQQQQALADEINLPLIKINSNLTKLIKLRTDVWAEYYSAYYVFSLGKLFSRYYYSSAGFDYSQFMIVPNSNFFAPNHYALLFNQVVSGNLTLLSGGGELTRYQKMQILSENPLAQKYLHSCLTQAFNCGVCQKCKRNLLTLDALNCLDNFSAVYDIEYYKANREEYFYYLCSLKKDNILALEHYLSETYNTLKARNPKTFAKIEEQFTAAKILELRKANKNIQNRLNFMFKFAKNPKSIENTADFFEQKGYKNVILYGQNGITDLLATLQSQLNINITHVVENTTRTTKIPRLPIKTVDYPPTDAVIICALNDKEVIYKKLQQRLTVPIHFANEILNHVKKD